MTNNEEKIQYAVNSLMVACVATVDNINGNGTVDLTINELQKFNSDTWLKQRGSLFEVPVAKFKFGAFSVDTPIKAGDSVIVLFCDGNVITNPFSQRDDRRHTANNAVVIAGLEGTNSNKPLEDFYAIRHNDKPIFKIANDGSEVIIDAKLTVTQDVQMQSAVQAVGAVSMQNTLSVVGTSTMSTVNTSTISASTGMTVAGQQMKNHKHGGVQQGSDYTGTPV